MFKKTLAAVAVLGAFAGSAFAANVTMYGIIDTGLGYTSTDRGYGEDVNKPEFADLFYAYGVLDSGRFIGESSHLVGLGSNQASFYLRA